MHIDCTGSALPAKFLLGRAHLELHLLNSRSRNQAFTGIIAVGKERAVLPYVSIGMVDA